MRLCCAQRHWTLSHGRKLYRVVISAFDADELLVHASLHACFLSVSLYEFAEGPAAERRERLREPHRSLSLCLYDTPQTILNTVKLFVESKCMRIAQGQPCSLGSLWFTFPLTTLAGRSWYGHIGQVGKMVLTSLE